MKVAVTTTGKGLSDNVDSRFGRAKGFVFFDTENDEVVHIENSQNLNAVQGAGIQAAEKVISMGAEVVITGHCGPKAFRTLQAGGVKVYLGVVKGTVGDALEKFKKCELSAASSPDVEGHW